jgi:hypothetical protein
MPDRISSDNVVNTRGQILVTVRVHTVRGFTTLDIEWDR